MSDHPRIYLQPECCATPDVGRLWCQDDEPVECPDGEPWTCYVRVDLSTEERDREIFSAGWKHGERVGRGAGPTDSEIRELVRSVAQATVERCAEVFVEEWTAPNRPAAELTTRKHEIVHLITTATMADADEDPEAPLNALRRLP